MKRQGFTYNEAERIASYTVELFNQVWNDEHTSFRSVPSGKFSTRSIRFVDNAHVEFTRVYFTSEGLISRDSKIVKVVGKRFYEYTYKCMKTQINVNGQGAEDLVKHFSDDLWANMLSGVCDHAIDNMKAAKA